MTRPAITRSLPTTNSRSPPSSLPPLSLDRTPFSGTFHGIVPPVATPFWTMRKEYQRKIDNFLKQLDEEEHDSTIRAEVRRNLGTIRKLIRSKRSNIDRIVTGFIESGLFGSKSQIRAILIEEIGDLESEDIRDEDGKVKPDSSTEMGKAGEKKGAKKDNSSLDLEEPKSSTSPPNNLLPVSDSEPKEPAIRNRRPPELDQLQQ